MIINRSILDALISNNPLVALFNKYTHNQKFLVKQYLLFISSHRYFILSVLFWQYSIEIIIHSTVKQLF